MKADIDYEVEQKLEQDLGGGGSANRQNEEKPTWWQRLINWLKELLRL